MRITDHQKEFLLEHFFKNKNYHGWRKIAENLLTDGFCIVAGRERLWIGGIGNFIKISEAENVVGCSLFEFNLEEFLESLFFKEYKSHYINIIHEDLRGLKNKYEELYLL